MSNLWGPTMKRWLSTRRKRDAAVLIVAVLGVGALVATYVVHESKPESGPTSWEKIMAMVNPDGSPTRDMALQTFALAYGGLPGVTPPSGPDGPEQSASPAAAWILKYWDTLNPEQQKVAAGKLRLDFTPSTVHSGLKRTASAIPGLDIHKCNALGDEVSSQDAPPEFANAFPGVRATIEKLIGVTLDAEVRVCVADMPVKNHLAETLSHFGLDGKLRCRVTFFPSGQSKTGAERLQITAHELTHCFNAQMAGHRKDFAGYVTIPGWINEGICNWVAYNVAGATQVLSDWAARYSEDSRVPLIQRTYDAMMFYQHIDNARGDMAQTVQRVVGASGDNYSVAAFQAATEGDSYKVLNSHPASWLRQGRGQQMAHAQSWNMWSPGLGNNQTHFDVMVVVPDGEPAVLESGPWGGNLATIRTTADVMMIRLDRGDADTVYGRYSPEPESPSLEFDLGLAASAIFCAKEGGCKCPDGSVDPLPDFTEINQNTGYISVFGAGASSGVSAVGFSMDSFCKKKPKVCHKLLGSPSRGCDDQQPPGGGGVIVSGGCGGRCASTGGEPHQRTFDGYGYDMQAVGEFVLAKSTVDDFQVQTRTTPVPKTTTASMNTATAMNVAGDRVAVYTTPASATLKVNGSVITPGEDGQVKLPKGGKVQSFGGGIANRPSYDITWPDGTYVGVETYLPWGIGVRVGLPESRYGKVVGQLGNADGVPDNDFRTRDGRQLAQNLSWEDFYHVFVDSWRLSTSESLFDYEAGQNTETFTDKTFPKEHVDPKTLPGRSEAEAICRTAGITDPAMLENCIFDIVMTGDKIFADINADLQKFYAGSKLLKDGDSVSGTLSGSDLNMHGLDVGDAKAFFLTDWSGTIDPCKATIIIEGARGYQTKCENKVLQVGLPSKPSGPLAVSVGNSGTPGSYKFTFITAKIRDFTIKPGDKVTGNIDVRGRVDIYYLDATQVLGISNRPETCNSIYAEHTNLGDTFGLSGVFGYGLEEVPICGNPRTLITTNDKQGQRWVLVVRSRTLSTGLYTFTFG